MQLWVAKKQGACFAGNGGSDKTEKSNRHEICNFSKIIQGDTDYSFLIYRHFKWKVFFS
jgi:hypothetical protein